MTRWSRFISGLNSKPLKVLLSLKTIKLDHVFVATVYNFLIVIYSEICHRSKTSLWLDHLIIFNELHTVIWRKCCTLVNFYFLNPFVSFSINPQDCACLPGGRANGEMDEPIYTVYIHIFASRSLTRFLIGWWIMLSTWEHDRMASAGDR